MSNYNNLKTTIDANIKQNGNQEITGSILNSVLNQMVNILGTGYQFAGIATLDPATEPGTPDAKVFYIANGKGTYTNFGGLEVTEDDVVVLYYDTAWHKVATGIASQDKLAELGHKVDNIENVEESGKDDVLIESNDGNFVGKIDNEGGHFKGLYLQSDEEGTDKVDVAEAISKFKEIIVEEETEEIVVTSTGGQEIAKVDNNGIHTKELFINGVPVSSFQPVGMTAIFDNWGFIGDSLSSGFLAAPDIDGENPALPVADGSKGRNIYRMSWGQIMARMYGAKATNFSVGGLTAKAWLDFYPNKTSENGYNSEDGSFNVTFNEQAKSAYTICLGTNDSADSSANPVGNVATDIDVNDYHNNADTFAGNYAKIIQMCKALTPSCKIFVITPFKWWSMAAENKGYNAVVRSMPTIFDNVFLIDLYNDYINYLDHHEYGAHGNTLGYVFAANVIARAIDGIVRENEDTFKFQSIVCRAKHDNGQY